MMDAASRDWEKERAATQMTLGKLIDRLKGLPAEMPIQGIASPHSYRGYYSDLAFEGMAGATIPVSSALRIAQDCMGEVFEGYKGGDFLMGRNTPIWVANYGCCGLKIMSLSDDGAFTTEEDKF